jgi:hypothetical protein
MRDSPVVVLLDIFGALISLSLAVWLGRSGSLRRAGILDYFLGGVYTGVLTSAGPIPVSVADIEWRDAVRGRWKGQALAVSRGVLLAAPLLVLFGALLVAADAIFERLITEVFGFDLAEVFSHLILITFFAWITAGVLWAGLMAPYYLSTLSADAVPVLVEALPEIGDRRMWNGYTVEQAVVDRWDSGQADWRTWNLGRFRAHQVVRSHVEDQNVPASRRIRVNSNHQDRAFMHRTDRVIHNMLWIKWPQRGISGSIVTST